MKFLDLTGLTYFYNKYIKNLLNKSGDASSTTANFTQASARTNISTGETLGTIFGKVSKWFADLKTAAFQSVANALTTTTAGSVLDARQGKTLSDTINGVRTDLGDPDNLNTSAKSNVVAAVNELNSKRIAYLVLIEINVPTSSTTFTLQNGRKFSDHDYLVFVVGDEGYFRNPSILPRDVFLNAAVEIDYSTPDTTRRVNISYSSDTQVLVWGLSNAQQRLRVFGLKFTT